VRSTLKVMAKFTRAGRKDVGVVQLARSIVQPLPARDYRGQIDKLYYWTKQNIRYVADPREVETISTPAATLKMRCGDCDDMAVLLASLLEGIGNTTRFVAYAFDSQDAPYSHVVTEVKLAETWISLDPTVPSAVVGWKPAKASRMMVAHV
jgi:transglutaminase-like putative cysteine protease